MVLSVYRLYVSYPIYVLGRLWKKWFLCCKTQETPTLSTSSELWGSGPKTIESSYRDDRDDLSWSHYVLVTVSFYRHHQPFPLNVCLNFCVTWSNLIFRYCLIYAAVFCIKCCILNFKFLCSFYWFMSVKFKWISVCLTDSFQWNYILYKK